MSRQIVDSHQHFWDIKKFQYWWLSPDRVSLNRNFLPEDLKPLITKACVDRTVIVQAHPSVEEALWLIELADANDFIAGVVGWVDLTSPNIGKDLDLLQKHSKFKGIRHPIEAEPDDAWMLRKDVVSGLAELGRRDIPYDLEIWPRHLKYVPELRDKCPQVKLVVDHIALPPIADQKMDGWDRDMEKVAALPDVCCKLSGMITRASPNWTANDLKPYVDYIVGVFGYDRLMFGSDWPVCILAGSYQDVLDALRTVLGSISKEDASEVWGGTARTFYKLQ